MAETNHLSLLQNEKFAPLLEYLNPVVRRTVCKRMDEYGIETLKDLEYFPTESALKCILTSDQINRMNSEIKRLSKETVVDEKTKSSRDTPSMTSRHEKAAQSIQSDNDVSSKSAWPKPLPLVCSERDTHRLYVEEDTLKQLEQMDKCVNVVAIAGIYRTGKSYLLNRLAGDKSGFALGSTVQPETKGLWILCLDHPVNTDEVLVLLDTEGLGDMKKGNEDHDDWIFSLAILLSSTLVYNIKSVLDEGSLQKLNFITQLTKHIKTKNSEEGAKNYDLYFPRFVITLRDFALVLEIDGKEVTADEYMEHALDLLPENKQTKRYNDIRRCIRRYFKSRKCFTFDSPSGDKEVLKNLDKLKDEDLNKNFVKEVGEFCTYIYRHCPGKKLDTGHKVTGGMFAVLVRTYVNAIRDGNVLCIENALGTMAKRENTMAVSAATELYESGMSENLHLPTSSVDDLVAVHHKVAKDAIDYFLKKAFNDDDQLYQRELNVNIEKNFLSWKTRNESISQQKCTDMLDVLDQKISKKAGKGKYRCPGGYALFQDDLQELQEKYNQTPGLGVKAQKCLVDFLNQKKSQIKMILEVDKKLSKAEKEREEMHQETEEKNRQKKTKENEEVNKAKENDRIAELIQSNIDKLNEKHEAELANLHKHYEKVLTQRTEELDRTEKERFQEETEELKNNIEELREEASKGMIRKGFDGVKNFAKGMWSFLY